MPEEKKMGVCRKAAQVSCGLQNRSKEKTGTKVKSKQKVKRNQGKK
jgi:hypothetical protein